MSFFLSGKKLEVNKDFIIEGEEALHLLKARRVKNGEHILVQDPEGNRFMCTVSNINKKTLTATPIGQVPTPQEPPIHTSLLQALINEQALNTVLQKTTELGVNEIILFPSKRSQFPGFSSPSKKKRWEKITWEAVKQCDRVKAPALTIVSSLEEALNVSDGSLITLDITGTKPLAQHLPTQHIRLAVGPEGGWTPEEVTILTHYPHNTIWNIGPYTLRSETASIAGLTLIQYISSQK